MSESSTSSKGLSESSSSENLAECNCPGDTGPKVNVTLSWTDPDTTKSFLGCTFTNGETKAVCPTNYDKPNSEVWLASASGDLLSMFAFTATTRFYIYTAGGAKIRHAYYDFGPGSFVTTFNTPVVNLSSYAPVNGPGGGPGGPVVGNKTILDNQFGFITTTSGITISWARGVGF